MATITKDLVTLLNTNVFYCDLGEEAHSKDQNLRWVDFFQLFSPAKQLSAWNSPASLPAVTLDGRERKDRKTTGELFAGVSVTGKCLILNYCHFLPPNVFRGFRLASLHVLFYIDLDGMRLARLTFLYKARLGNRHSFRFRRGQGRI